MLAPTIVRIIQMLTTLLGLDFATRTMGRRAAEGRGCDEQAALVHKDALPLLIWLLESMAAPTP